MTIWEYLDVPYWPGAGRVISAYTLALEGVEATVEAQLERDSK